MLANQPFLHQFRVMETGDRPAGKLVADDVSASGAVAEESQRILPHVVERAPKRLPFQSLASERGHSLRWDRPRSPDSTKSRRNSILGTSDSGAGRPKESMLLAVKGGDSHTVRMRHLLRFLLCLVITVQIHLSRADERPNILFLFADDWGRYASIYGEAKPGGINDVVQTPTFDRIAREGVLFNQAHVSAPSCTPCRTSLLTGQHFWRTGTGSILLGATYPEDLPSFPVMLRDAGYHIGCTYKVWSPGTPKNAPYTDAENYAPAGSRFNGFSQNVTKMMKAGKSIEAAK